MTQSATLVEIVDKDKNENKIVNNLVVWDIDKYVIELIRISEMYKFELKIKRKTILKENKPLKQKNTIEIKKNIEEQINKAEDEEEKQYFIVRDDFENVRVDYGKDAVQIREVEYKVDKPKIRYQELWEKEGFYQERTTIAKVKVQLWPEHLPYDHFKRKKAFLFC